MEALSEEFKPVDLENYEFLNRQKFNVKRTPFAFSNLQGSNRRDTIRDCSLLETPGEISLSIQTLIQDSKTIVLEKDEFEFRENPIPVTLLPPLVNKDSKFDIEKSIHSASSKRYRLPT